MTLTDADLPAEGQSIVASLPQASVEWGTGTSASNVRRLAITGGVLFVVLAIITLAQHRDYEIPLLLAYGTYLVVGGLIVTRRPGNVIGLALVAYAVLGVVAIAGIVTAETLDEAARVDAAAWVTLLTSVVSPVQIALLAATWLLFPDGRPTTPSDRRLLRGTGVFVAVLSVLLLFASPQAFPETDRFPHPFLRDGVASTVYDIASVMFVIIFLFGIFVAIRLIRRMRHGDPVERRQVLWIAAAVILNITILIANAALQPLGTENRAFWLIDSVAIALIPIGIGVAIFRYHLYEIDVIISKSVTYLGLGAAITGLYVAVVLGPVLVLGASDDGGPGLLLPILATGAVAIVFEPVRVRMQYLANRLVYGDRATPHEVLSRVTSRLTDAQAGAGTEELARLLADGTGADQVVVWLRSGDTFAPDGVWQRDGVEPTPPARAIELPDDDEVTMTQPIVRRDEVFGALTLVKSKADPLTPGDRELLTDVAAGSGLLLRNIRLNRELLERATEVRESRRRLIAAQDAERHRLERDLHDGAQQRVVALKVKLGIARTIAGREGADAIAERLEALSDSVQRAVDDLRAVAHGIYPPLLESDGLEAALRAAERTSTIAIQLDADGLDRYGRTIEETAYFCVTETLERAHMSGARSARVEVAGRNGDLVTEIDVPHLETELDLGAVADRLDAAGGTLTVADLPADGRSIVSSLPLTVVEGALA